MHDDGKAPPEEMTFMESVDEIAVEDDTTEAVCIEIIRLISLLCTGNKTNIFFFFLFCFLLFLFSFFFINFFFFFLFFSFCFFFYLICTDDADLVTEIFPVVKRFSINKFNEHVLRTSSRHSPITYLYELQFFLDHNEGTLQKLKIKNIV